jgi:hypothetical protein
MPACHVLSHDFVLSLFSNNQHPANLLGKRHMRALSTERSFQNPHASECERKIRAEMDHEMMRLSSVFSQNRPLFDPFLIRVGEK